MRHTYLSLLSLLVLARGTVTAQPSSPLEKTPCQLLYNKGFSYHANAMWQETYDTLKHYVETCPDHANSHSAFVEMTSAVQYNSALDSNRYLMFREWLMSVVMYPSENPRYFCSAVWAIASTYETTNKVLAILQYMIEETECDNESVRDYYTQSRKTQYEQWLQTDTSLNKLDTTLPSLEELGLELLRQHSDVKSEFVGIATVRSMTAAPNPSSGLVTLSIDLSMSSRISVEVYDVLGKVVATLASDSFSESGPHELTADLRNLSSGQYFVRLSTSRGEIRTLNLINE
jgi:hypothetical protein